MLDLSVQGHSHCERVSKNCKQYTVSMRVKNHKNTTHLPLSTVLCLTPHSTHITHTHTHTHYRVYYVQLSRQLFVINHLIDVANMFLLTTK